MKLSSLLTVGTALFTIVVVRESDAANVVQCGDIISETTKLNDHLECDCNNGPALIVESATLNMNKKNVSCQEGTSLPYTNNAQGVITLLGKKSKVSNGFVIGNNDQTSYGVVLGGVGKHQLSNVEAVSFNTGILIDEYSSKNTISKCLSKDSYYAFVVVGNSNTLEQNEATSNNYNGFYVTGNSNTLKKNEAKENESDGFYVGGNSNTLKRNKATRNIYTGFVIYDATTGNTVKKNKAAENGFADYSVNCMTTTFVKNKGNDPLQIWTEHTIINTKMEQHYHNVRAYEAQ
eukprot:CAMPEP_0171036464 /NCGR_PEP_ID=MMETSP0736-20130129/41522_1 /TAXON_ID=186038 /ORGANISM="Fragilariopsis kerguelensis, Strain L26-C5" /LENGTH=290 /DNA_ID=CAMNT_0011481453 /DNA_START=102 /DNA_END=970 /DNA_ORIENTATION=-